MLAYAAASDISPCWSYERVKHRTVTNTENRCGSRKPPVPLRVLSIIMVVVAMIACGGTTAPSVTAPPAPAPTPVPAGPPAPLEGATVKVTAAGFVMDTSPAAFRVDDLHVYQGARLTFINTDNTPHDVLSDPPHIHTDCPEINAAGYLVPGQPRSTDPLNRIMTCGFHDHTHEGESAFAGKVTIESR